MNLVIIHSPYHLFILRNYLRDKYFNATNSIIVHYPYQNINIELLKQDALKIYKLNQNIVIKNYKDILKFNLIKIFFLNKKINKINDLKIRAIIKLNNVKRIYVFTDNLPFYVRALKTATELGINDLFLVEDGIAQYSKQSCWQLIINIIKIIFKIFLGYGYQLIKGYGSNKLINKHICFYPHLSVHSTNAEPLINNYSKNPIGCEKKEVIYISQPLSNLGIPENIEIKLIKKIYELCKELNWDFFIKPHPRDNINKFKNLPKKIIINTTNIAEEIVLQRKCVALAAISTAIFNLHNNFYYQDAYYLTEYFKIRSIRNKEILNEKKILSSINDIKNVLIQIERNNFGIDKKEIN